MTQPDQSAAKPLLVTVQDLRTARYCLAGARPWFKRHGFNWQAFLTHGIAAERLMAANATLARQVIRAAAAREAAEARLASEARGVCEAREACEAVTEEAGHGRS